MKKEFTIAFVILSLFALPAYAVSEHSNNSEHANESSKEHGNSVSEEHRTIPEYLAEDATITPEEIIITINVSPTVSKTPKLKNEDENLSNEKNVKEDVESSCDEDVKNHGEFVSCVAREHRGGESVSEAARSDIGKKEHDEDDINVTPTVSLTETPTISPSPITSALTRPYFDFKPWGIFKNLLSRFIFLLPFAHHTN